MVNKSNISISFGQGIDTKTDPRQVQAGKLIALTNATLSETLTLEKRNGYQPISTFITQVASSSLNNQKLGVFNNQLVAFDGKVCSVLGNNQEIFVDNFIAAQPSITTVAREATAVINQDAAYNSNANTTCYTWSSSCVASNFQQLSFAAATGKFQLLSANGSIISTTGIGGFVKTKVLSSVNNFYWTGVNYTTGALVYYPIPANGSSANFTTPISVGTLGSDFSSNTTLQGFNHYQRYDAVALSNNIYVGWFAQSTSTINISLITAAGVTTTKSFNGDASGALSIFGDNQNVWLVYHNGATSAGFAVYSTSALFQVSPPSPFFTNDVPTATNGGYACVPQRFTGVSNGPIANVYTQFLSYYAPTQYSGTTLAWNSLQRSDWIGKQSLNATLSSTSGSSAVVVRGMGITSRAFNYLGDDFFMAGYGGTQTSTSADRLEPTYFLIAPQRSTNNISAKLAFQNGAGYDFETGGQANYGVNNYGSVGYGLPLCNVFTTVANQTTFQVPYLIKTAATPLSSTGLQEPFFISYNFGVNNAALNFNAPTLYNSASYGNNLNVSGGYLAAFDGKNINEQNFHLYPEDVQLVGSSAVGNVGTTQGANTYSYQVWYQYQDAQGNIFKSAPSKTYNITTLGSSAVFLLVPTIRATNKKNVSIHVARNAPTLDPLTFHEINPLNPVLNNPNIDNVVIQDSNTDTSIIGNTDIYTTGGVLEDTGAPSPLWQTVYKLRLMVLDPENNIWWYSKQVIPGTTVEMTDLQTFSISTKYGNSTCGLEMDDKFIIFTRTQDGSLGAIYYMTGQGPDATGNNNDFSIPNLISTTLTTNNPNGLVLTPDGIMFPSDKGIWVLGHDLSVNYIGAPVEAYNTTTITSAQIIPNTTQVRFTLNTGICLVWDYFQRQWSVFSNINATHGIVYQSLFTYLNQAANKAFILQETPGQYQDQSAPIFMNLTMSWLSMAGFQGFQRVSRLYLIGQSQSPHILNVSVAYDYNPSVVQTAQMIPVSNSNKTWGGDPSWGANQNWGGSFTTLQRRMNLNRQKCQTIQISIQESLDPAYIVYGPGPLLEAIGIVVGTKLNYPKIPDSHSVK